jgi:acyl-CoA dehydrogenase
LKSSSWKNVSRLDPFQQQVDGLNSYYYYLGVPAEPIFEAQLSQANGRWMNPPVLEDLKRRARSLGLWNLFLSKHSEGAGYTNLEYALMAECLGMSRLAPEVCDTSGD